MNRTRTIAGDRRHRRPRLAAAACLVAAICATQAVVRADDAIAREFSVGAGPMFFPVSTDAISREFTVGAGAMFGDAVPVRDAISREFVVGVGNSFEDIVAPRDAIGREFSVGLGERYRVGITDAISREFSARTTLPNLAPTSITAPDTITVGESFTVSWTVENNGDRSPDGAWIDRIHISPVPELGLDSRVLCEIEITPPLDPDTDYTRVLECTVPAALELEEGIYWLIVETDAEYDVLESDETDNILSSPEVQLILPPPVLIDGESWLVH